MELDLINDTFTPITDKTFEKQGWERYDVDEENDEPYHYWMLPLPKDNPDKDAKCLISSANDQWEDMGLKKGQFTVDILNFNGLGFCNCEEDIEDLYLILTKTEIMDDRLSNDNDNVVYVPF